MTKISLDILWDLIIIGGGPSGMMAAGRAAERAREEGRNIKILLLEKNNSLGRKLLITGGGRCNVTNAELDNRTLLAKFKDSDKFLFSAFSQYSVKETLAFFNGHGMQTKIEEGKRVFPLSNKSQSVWDVLVENLKGKNKDGSAQVTVHSNAEVIGFVQSKPDIIDGVKLKNDSKSRTMIGSSDTSIIGDELIHGRLFILATGGKSHPETGSTGDGFKWLSKLGHKVIEPTAALVPIKVSDAWVKKLSGISLKDAKMTIFLDGVKQDGNKKGGKNTTRKGLPAGRQGKILFTHFGLSGPAILNMSSEIGELLKYGEVVLSLDLLPMHDYSTLNTALQKLFAEEHKKKLKNALDSLIPASFVPTVIKQSNVNGETFCNSVTREERLALVKALKDLPIHPTGLMGTDKAIITSGGVALEEVDFRTMQSRLISNLYLVGDLLNVDRPSGGYSLQLCWTTGWVAGNAAAI